MENSNNLSNSVRNKSPIEELDSNENSLPESRVTSPNRKLFPHCQIKSTLETIRTFLVVFVITLLIFGFIYNFFASKEKDIPEEIFQKLLNVLATDVQPRFLPMQAPRNTEGAMIEYKKSNTSEGKYS